MLHLLTFALSGELVHAHSRLVGELDRSRVLQRLGHRQRRQRQRPRALVRPASASSLPRALQIPVQHRTPSRREDPQPARVSGQHFHGPLHDAEQECNSAKARASQSAERKAKDSQRSPRKVYPVRP